MKILSQGELPNPQAIVDCRKCKTKFQFAESEGEFVSDQRDGGCIKIKCPTCQQEHWVDVRLFR